MKTVHNARYRQLQRCPLITSYTIVRVSGRKLTNPGAACDTGGVSVHA